MEGHKANHASEFQNYPFLTGEEFTEVCHHLERKYCQATLGPVRRQWRLRVCTALDTTLAFDSGYTTFIQIIRPLEGELDHGDLSTFLDNFSFGEVRPEDETEVDDREMVEAEDADQEVLPKGLKQPDFGYVTYEVHLHPTYRAPCLWFSLHNLSADEPAFNIDTVFRRLVPDQFKDSLRRAGPIGGISADHHPVTGVPAFFVHPCLLGDAMSSFGCSKEDYLMIWLGLVGGCVGLWVPKEMALR
ncbi:Ubiquitin-like-conjugating enzyme ATG10 [Pleurostoma richardsiae]|uniref:Ubiquitin-like-conjugating enzyme ATG10 n=1 Tax=Pleurostoma richardsiae TaxID=41990 RepID=A0AA38VDH1_9PEZI|nr:Ubiquitin-like-conjugating enzyme ATG10 [Pleurostoma richardsiae]